MRRLGRDYHTRQVGRREPVLTQENKPNATTLAHNSAYRPVVLPGVHAAGRWVEARYVGATDFHLRAEPVGTLSAELARVAPRRIEA